MRNYLRALSLSALILFFMIIPVAYGQEQLRILINPDEISLLSDEGGDAGELSIPFALVNQGGVPASGLSSEAFQLHINGETAPFSLSQMADESQPLEIMVVIDASDGMLDSGSFELVKQTVIEFRQSLSLNDELGVYLLRDTVSPVGSGDPNEFGLSRDGGGAINFILSYSPDGSDGEFPLFDGLFRAANGFESRALSGKRRAIVLIAQNGEAIEDGLPDASQNADLDLAIFEAQRLGIPFFTVGLAGGDRYQALQLQKTSLMTGGTYFGNRSSADLGSALAEIRDQMRLTTELNVTLTPELAGPPLLIDLEYERPGAFAQQELLYDPEGVMGAGLPLGVSGSGNNVLLWLGSLLLAAIVGLAGASYFRRSRQTPAPTVPSPQPKSRPKPVSDSNKPLPPSVAQPNYPRRKSEPTIVDESFKPITLGEQSGASENKDAAPKREEDPLTVDPQPDQKPGHKQLHKTVILGDLEIPETQILDNIDLPQTQILENPLSDEENDEATS